MKVRELLSLWEQSIPAELTQERFNIRLPLEDAAKLQALAEMFPRHSVEEIITDLLSAALNELESGLPYVRGEKVVALDEEGDPLYEDVGLTPRYLLLIQKYLSHYRRPAADTHQ